MNRWLARATGQTVRMRFPRRTTLLPLWAAAAVAALAVSGVGSGAAAPAAVPPLLLPAQVGPSSSQTGMLQASRARFDCIDRVNAERARVSLPPVSYDVRLAQAASDHAVYQASKSKMGHTGSGGSNGGNRMTAAGYQWNAWGENVAAGQPNCATVMSAWMNSPTHRANILNPVFEDIGMGMALAANGSVYWTMDLARGG